jgi:hypothetical protein
MDKENIYVHNGVLFNHENAWNCLICDNMVQSKRLYKSEISQGWKTGYTDLVHKRNLKMLVSESEGKSGY